MQRRRRCRPERSSRCAAPTSARSASRCSTRIRCLPRGCSTVTPPRDRKRFFSRRIERALRLRERLYPAPYYRLVHAEADGLPGLVIDRFGAVLVVQTNTAGMERLLPLVIEALRALLSPEAIVLRNDSPARSLEGLAAVSRMAHGAIDGPVTLDENGVAFSGRCLGGQKTGWFYDQRDNRGFIARLAEEARVLDLYCYSGGFAVTAPRRAAPPRCSASTAPRRRWRSPKPPRGCNGVGRSLHVPPRRGICRGRRAVRSRRAVRHRRRRPAAFRALEARRAGGAARLPQVGAARGAADRARRVPVHCFVLAQCRRRRSSPTRCGAGSPMPGAAAASCAAAAPLPITRSTLPCPRPPI